MQWIMVVLTMSLSAMACGLTQEEYVRRRAEEVEACLKAFPDSPAKPVWRPCGNGSMCFFCADSGGVLTAVVAPKLCAQPAQRCGR